MSRLSAADRALGLLDGVSMLLPDPELFLYMYVRKEAVLSSQIEGTQSTLSDLLRFEIEAVDRRAASTTSAKSRTTSTRSMYGLERLREASRSRSGSSARCTLA